MPPLSDTEREALEAGTVGWDAEILSGKPNWDVLMDLGPAKFTDEEQAFLDGPLKELCEMIDDHAIMTSEERDLPAEVWEFMKKNKFFGLCISKEYGGLEFSALAHSEIVQTLSTRSLTAAVTVMVPNSLGPGELVAHYGTDEQKEYYLRRLAEGEEIPCFGLTNPNAGSDAGSIPDEGVVYKDENGDLKIRINCEKRYITLAPVATVVGLAFQLKDPDNLLQGTGKEGITCALIPRDTKGLKIGDRHDPMGIPFQNGPIWGENVEIPVDYIIGGQKNAGTGWRMLMECLSIGRSISLPSQSVAGAKLAAYVSGAYSMVRKQFKLQIGKFEGVEEKLGSIAAQSYLIDGARTATAQMVDNGEKPSIPSAILKYHATEKMRQTILDAMDVNAGKDVINGPKNYLANVYKGVPVAITVEGANIMTRNLIIYGQGGVRAHPYLLKEIQAAALPDKKEAARTLTKLLAQHVLTTIWHMGRSMIFGFTGGALTKTPTNTKETQKYYKRINRLSAIFRVTSDMTYLFVGGGLKRKESLSARMGDISSNIYLASTTLKHYEQRGAKKDEIPVMQWATEKALYDAEMALKDLLANYPNWFGKTVLKVLSTPIGGWHKKPSDRLTQKAAQSITQRGELRDRLTHGVYVSSDETDNLGELEAAFVAASEAYPLEKKLAAALHKGEANPLSAEEQKIVDRAEELRQRVIAVDHYTPAIESNAFNSAEKAAKGKSKPKAPKAVPAA